MIRMSTKKVTMGFSERDLDNVELLQRELHSRSKASAVAQSLDIAKWIVQTKRKGGKIILTDESGQQRELVIPGLSE